MQTALRCILIAFLVGIVLSGNAQTNRLKTDSANIVSLQIYRQHFWDSLPKPKGVVNDYEELYSLDEKHTLDSIIKRFKRDTGIEIAIVTIDTNCVSMDNFENLTLHIGNTWGVGQKGKDNGILIAISKGYHRMRIENGYGIEKLISDKETHDIIYAEFIPYFKNGKYYDGTRNGLLKLIELLNKK